jgi:hypothetical protein
MPIKKAKPALSFLSQAADIMRLDGIKISRMLAIDPGDKALGFAVRGEDGKISSGTVYSTFQDSENPVRELDSHLHCIKNWREGERAKLPVSAVDRFLGLGKGDPDVVLVEEPLRYSAHRNANTIRVTWFNTGKICGFYGRICPVIMVSPSEWRGALGVSFSSKKEAKAEAIKMAGGFLLENELRFGRAGIGKNRRFSSDEADALCILAYGIASLSGILGEKG